MCSMLHTQDSNTPLHIARKKYCLEAASVLESHDQTVLEVKNNVSNAARTEMPAIVGL